MTLFGFSEVVGIVKNFFVRPQENVVTVEKDFDDVQKVDKETRSDVCTTRVLTDLPMERRNAIVVAVVKQNVLAADCNTKQLH